MLIALHLMPDLYLMELIAVNSTYSNREGLFEVHILRKDKNKISTILAI